MSELSFDRFTLRLVEDLYYQARSMTMSEGNPPQFGISNNVKLVGRTDLAGGGQVVVENGYAYVGHMDPPHGTTILDVKIPNIEGGGADRDSPSAFA
jgi:hypothetical protein